MSRIDRKYIEQLEEVQKLDNKEIAHREADAILCEFLRALTYTEVVDAYEKIGKWYA